MKNNNFIGNLSVNIAVSIIAIIFILFCISITGFIFKLPINVFYVLFSLIIGFFILFIKCKKFNFTKSQILITFLSVFIILSVSIFLSGKFFDDSWDGKGYHQSAVIFLKSGWNPIFINIKEFVSDFAFKINDLIFIQNYPKFSEVIASNIYKFTGFIETAKAVNILSCTALFFYSYFVFDNYLLRKNKFTTKLFYAFLTVYNPIVISQIMTFYVDGLLYCWFMLAFFSIVNIVQTDKITKTDLFILFSSLIILVNIKLGGILYSLVILVIFTIYLLLIKDIIKLKIILKSFFISLLISTILLINPYIQNIINGNSAFYPLTGKNKIEILNNSTPKEFHKKSILYKFFISTFARVDNFDAFSNKKIKLKLPFSIQKDELEALEVPDTRICGFGVLWSAIFLFAFFTFLFYRNTDFKSKQIYFLGISILLTGLVLNPFNWWARYVPQLYFLPLFISIFCINKVKVKFLAYFIASLIFINSSIVYFIHFRYSIYCNDLYSELLNSIKQTQIKEQAPIKIYLKDSIHEYSFLIRLEEHNIPYEIIDKQQYKRIKKPFYSFNKLCFPEEIQWSF